MVKERERLDADCSDTELLSRLRSGDAGSYTELWRRHVQAALRVGHRLAPGQAEDLVAESFTAVYEQIVNRGNGPESAFRAYLFTTMRNTAMRWQQAGRLIDNDPDIDETLFEDGLSWVEDRAESADLLAAFQSIPERWQRVLWLSEVEEVGRAVIAAELGIKPNAVSVLLRRAKTGLRLQYLTRQVPAELREDPAHVAGQLPALILRSIGDGPPKSEIRAHLAACARCAEVDAELRTNHRQMGKATLGAAGFAALAVVLPSLSPAPVAAAGIGIAGLTAIAASAALVIAAGTVVGERVLRDQADTSTSTTTATAEQTDTGRGSAEQDRGAQAGASQNNVAPGNLGTSETDSTPAEPLLAEPQPVEAEPQAPLGRGNADPSIPSISVGGGGQPSDFTDPPARPTPAPPGTLPDPGTADPALQLTAGIQTQPAASGFIAPVLTGSATPGAAISVRVQWQPESGASGTAPPPQEFSLVPGEPSPAGSIDTAGNWSFDLRTVLSSEIGSFEVQVAAFTDSGAGEAESRSFTLSPPSVQGFEALAVWNPSYGFGALPIEEANSTGVVFSATGPANGELCLHSPFSGQEQSFALNSAGSMTQRIRFLSPGTYLLVFRVCENTYRGPATEIFVDVEGGLASPFGFGDAEPLELAFSDI